VQNKEERVVALLDDEGVLVADLSSWWWSEQLAVAVDIATATTSVGARRERRRNGRKSHAGLVFFPLLSE